MPILVHIVSLSVCVTDTDGHYYVYILVKQSLWCDKPALGLVMILIIFPCSAAYTQLQHLTHVHTKRANSPKGDLNEKPALLGSGPKAPPIAIAIAIAIAIPIRSDRKIPGRAIINIWSDGPVPQQKMMTGATGATVPFFHHRNIIGTPIASLTYADSLNVHNPENHRCHAGPSLWTFSNSQITYYIRIRWKAVLSHVSHCDSSR